MSAGLCTFLSSGRLAAIGGVGWLGFVVWSVIDLRSVSWATALLAFAALVLVPLLIELVREPGESCLAVKLLRLARAAQLPAAILLVTACTQPAGWLAGGLAVAWVALTGIFALAGVMRIGRRGFSPVSLLCRDAGLVFIAVGGAWTFADRLGLHPVGFGSDIVQLTAVHFHFAGLVLPVVTGLVLREFTGSRIAATAGLGVLAGVPLVAIGITSTQLGGGHVMEFFAALVLATSAIVVAWYQLRLAAQNRWRANARLLWFVSGVSLVFGMSLALLYSVRAYGMPLPWLDIPWMRALHGTANALGFALCGVLGWWSAARDRPSADCG